MPHSFGRHCFGKVKRTSLVFTWLVFVLTMGTVSFSQSSAINGPWSGWAQCQITVQGPYSYSHSETHTWTLTGGQPTIQGAMRIHPATWKVTGQGSFTKTQGAQTLSAQWTTNATQANAPISLFVRASDGRLILKSWHAQLRVAGGVVGTQQQTLNGVAQSPGAISAEAFEWAFPATDGVSTSTQFSGSNSIATNGAVGPMQPGGSQGTAACTWRFAAGSNSVTTSPPTPTLHTPDHETITSCVSPTSTASPASAATCSSELSSTPESIPKSFTRQ